VTVSVKPADAAGGSMGDMKDMGDMK